MRLAITTRVREATDTKGQAVVAEVFGLEKPQRYLMAWDHSLTAQQNHAKCAHALADDLGWVGSWQGGQMMDWRYVFVPVEVTPTFSVEPSPFHYE